MEVVPGTVVVVPGGDVVEVVGGGAGTVAVVGATGAVVLAGPPAARLGDAAWLPTRVECAGAVAVGAARARLSLGAVPGVMDGAVVEGAVGDGVEVTNVDE